MRRRLTVLAFVILLGVISEARVSLDDLDGIWTGPIDLPFLFVLTERGIESYCRSSLTSECEASLSPGSERIAIDNGTFSINFTTLLGDDSKEKAAKMFSECAASGVYPLETIALMPPAPIQSYDPTTGHLTFIDSRRPDDVNCVIVRLKEGQRGKPSTISVRYIISSLETLDKFIKTGPSVRCVDPIGLCISESAKDGRLTSFISVEFELPCKKGACVLPGPKPPLRKPWSRTPRGPLSSGEF